MSKIRIEQGFKITPRVQSQGSVKVPAGGIFGIFRGLEPARQHRDWTRRTILKPFLIIMASLLFYSANGICNETVTVPLEPSTPIALKPKITLFESIKIIQDYLVDNKIETKGMTLYSASLTYMENHPRKGLCWHYYWSEEGVLGGEDFSIYHYMDGEIKLLHHGP